MSIYIILCGYSHSCGSLKSSGYRLRGPEDLSLMDSYLEFVILNLLSGFGVRVLDLGHIYSDKLSGF